MARLYGGDPTGTSEDRLQRIRTRAATTEGEIVCDHALGGLLKSLRRAA